MSLIYYWLCQVNEMSGKNTVETQQQTDTHSRTHAIAVLAQVQIVYKLYIYERHGNCEVECGEDTAHSNPQRQKISWLLICRCDDRVFWIISMYKFDTKCLTCDPDWADNSIAQLIVCERLKSGWMRSWHPTNYANISHVCTQYNELVGSSEWIRAVVVWPRLHSPLKSKGLTGNNPECSGLRYSIHRRLLDSFAYFKLPEIIVQLTIHSSSNWNIMLATY